MIPFTGAIVFVCVNVYECKSCKKPYLSYVHSIVGVSSVWTIKGTNQPIQNGTENGSVQIILAEQPSGVA